MLEWITALIGALAGVLAMQALNWRTMVKLEARVRALEDAMEELRPEEDYEGEDNEPYGRQCVDLSEEWQGIAVATEPVVMAPAHTPLPVIRHMDVHALLMLLPRRGVRVQPSLDGQGIKITATYVAMQDYHQQIGEALEFDMKRVVENTGKDWELTVLNRPEFMQYEFRILKHDGVVHE